MLGGNKAEVGTIAALKSRPSRDGGENKRLQPIDRRRCVELLTGRVGPISEDLMGLLDIPQTMFDISDPQSLSDEVHLSSDPDQTLRPVVAHLLHGRPVPVDVPDYAISLVSSSDNVFCVFANKDQGIVVYEHVGGMYSESSWHFFEEALRRTIGKAANNRDRNLSFRLVINKEGSMTEV